MDELQIKLNKTKSQKKWSQKLSTKLFFVLLFLQELLVKGKQAANLRPGRSQATHHGGTSYALPHRVARNGSERTKNPMDLLKSNFCCCLITICHWFCMILLKEKVEIIPLLWLVKSCQGMWFSRKCHALLQVSSTKSRFFWGLSPMWHFPTDSSWGLKQRVLSDVQNSSSTLLRVREVKVVQLCSEKTSRLGAICRRHGFEYKKHTLQDHHLPCFRPTFPRESPRFYRSALDILQGLETVAKLYLKRGFLRNFAGYEVPMVRFTFLDYPYFQSSARWTCAQRFGGSTELNAWFPFMTGFVRKEKYGKRLVLETFSFFTKSPRLKVATVFFASMFFHFWRYQVQNRGVSQPWIWFRNICG